LLAGLAMPDPVYAQTVWTEPGYYSSPTYSGGTFSVDAASPGSSYYLDGNTYGSGRNSSYYNFYLNIISCTGQITTTFAWNKNTRNDPPPALVTVVQNSAASWSTLSGGGELLKSCNNGLGDSEVTGSAQGWVGGNSYGIHTSVVVPDTDGKVILQCTPNVTISHAGHCVVIYSATAQPYRVHCFVSGTTPANPTPLVLTSNATLPIPLSAAITIDSLPATSSQPSIPVTVTPTIYDSAQNPVVTLPAQVLTFHGNGTMMASFSWDGLKSDGSPAPPGEYLFQFSAVVRSPLAEYTDKSPYLGISGSDVQLVSDDGTTAQFAIRYNLSSSDIWPSRSASAGGIDVYDPNQTRVTTQALGTGDMTPGLHTITVTMPSLQLEGDYVFLISAKDNDADHDVVVGQRWALQHNAKYKNGIITLVTSGNYHIAWCHANRSVHLFTLVTPGGSAPHAPRNWVAGVPNKSIRAAVNGSLFNVTTSTIPGGGAKKASDIQDVGEVAAGNLGPPPKFLPIWKAYDPCLVRRWSFGMQATLNQPNLFMTARMKTVRNKAGQIINNVADPTIKAYPYGFSGVGLLVHGGIAVPDPSSSIWPVSAASVKRTAIAWSTRGDFFLVTTSKGSWSSVGNWFLNSLPGIVDPKSMSNIKIQDVVMLDGGGSTEFGYEYNYTTPAATDDGGAISDGRYIPTSVGAQYP